MQVTWNQSKNIFLQWIFIYRSKWIDYDRIEYTMSWTVNNATMDYDNSKVEFMVVDVKGGYIENQGWYIITLKK